MKLVQGSLNVLWISEVTAEHMQELRHLDGNIFRRSLPARMFTYF
jgi:hypothetical protein